MNLALGLFAVVLGGLATAAGVTVAVVEGLRQQGEGFAEQTLKSLGILKQTMDAFGRLRPPAQLLVVGLVLIGFGTWLLVERPI